MNLYHTTLLHLFSFSFKKYEVWTSTLRTDEFLVIWGGVKFEKCYGSFDFYFLRSLSSSEMTFCSETSSTCFLLTVFIVPSLAFIRKQYNDVTLYCWESCSALEIHRRKRNVCFDKLYRQNCCSHSHFEDREARHLDVDHVLEDFPLFLRYWNIAG